MVIRLDFVIFIFVLFHSLIQIVCMVWVWFVLSIVNFATGDYYYSNMFIVSDTTLS